MSLPTPTPVPLIKVSIEYKGDKVEYYGSHFIDAISFICKAEEALRINRKLNEPCDISTTEIGRENLRKLLDKRNTT